MSGPVANPDEIAAIAAAIAEAPLATFDLEFLSADRLTPVLCLAQVSWLPSHSRLDVPEAAIVATVPEVRLLDALAVDLRPVFEALARHPLVVAHAPRQDLALVYTRFGIAMPNSPRIPSSWPRSLASATRSAWPRSRSTCSA